MKPDQEFTELSYQVTNEEAWASVMQLYVAFEVEEDGKTKQYQARATYVNGGWMEDIEVTDEDSVEVDDNAIYEIGKELLEDLDINKNLTW